MTWHDDGVSLTLDVSTSGTFITPPVRVAYPFLGDSGNSPPTGWTPYVPTGSSVTDISLGVSDGLALISRSLGATVSQTYDMGIERADFLITPHHTYQVSILFRGDSQLFNTTMPTLSVSFYRASGAVAFTRQSRPFASMPDGTNWYTFTVDQKATASDGEGCNRLRIVLMARCPTGAPTGSRWAGHWTDLAITDVTVANAPTFTWREVTCDTMEASVRYGRQRFTERYDVGTFNILINNVSGEYMYQDPHPWGLRPGRMLRMRATYKGATYPICFGVIDRIKTDMQPDGKATVAMTVYDTTSYTSDIPTPQISFMNPSMANDPDALSGNRVNALLNYAGLASVMRVIDPGVFPMQNVAESGRGLREEIGVTGDSEGGAFFGERDGTIVYRDRSWPTRDPRGGVVQANFTAFPNGLNVDLAPDDVPTDPNAPVICPGSMDTDWSLERVINTITLAVTGGTKQFFRDDTSQKENGIRTYQRLDFVNTTYTTLSVNTQLAARAQDIFSTSLKALLRVQRLSFRPAPATWEFTFSFFLNWLVRVFYYNRQGTWGFSTVVRIQSIEHRITPTDWVVTCDIDQPIAYTDDLVPLPPGGWDVADWDAAVWDDEQFTNAALWSAGFNWSNPSSKWGE